MVASTLKVLAANPGSPIADNDRRGPYAHDMVELFAKQGVSLVVVRPFSLAEGSTQVCSRQKSGNANARAIGRASRNSWARCWRGAEKPPPVADGERHQRQMTSSKGMWT